MIIFDPHLVTGNTDVLIVGLGGTGSALARHVCRTIYHMREARLQTPKSIKFIDMDIVEAGNIGRQAFAPGDIGQYKAEVLAKRFNAALGMDIEWYNEPFNIQQHLTDYANSNNTIILGCVDNHLARQALMQANAIWIDSGNHFNSGQVIIGNTNSAWGWKHNIPAAPKVKKMKAETFVASGIHALETQTEQWRYLPNAGLIFPALLEPEPEPVNAPILSCAELIVTGSQSLLINDMVAGVAANYFYRLMLRQPITSFMTYVDGDLLSMRSIPITVDDIEAYIGSEAA